jgi:predicted ATPase with chaperone activity
VAELLNRLIIPLERRRDTLNLPSGRSFQIPFDLIVVLATNLPPESLVDEAFLRRVPFTILAGDPSEDQFREVFHRTALAYGLKYDEDQIDYLLDKHYRRTRRPLRFCHARDLLQQVRNSCDFLGQPMVVTNDHLDAAVQNCLALRPGS